MPTVLLTAAKKVGSFLARNLVKRVRSFATEKRVSLLSRLFPGDEEKRNQRAALAVGVFSQRSFFNDETIMIPLFGIVVIVVLMFSLLFQITVDGITLADPQL